MRKHGEKPFGTLSKPLKQQHNLQTYECTLSIGTFYGLSQEAKNIQNHQQHMFSTHGCVSNNGGWFACWWLPILRWSPMLRVVTSCSKWLVTEVEVEPTFINDKSEDTTRLIWTQREVGPSAKVAQFQPVWTTREAPHLLLIFTNWKLNHRSGVNCATVNLGKNIKKTHV